MFASLWNSVSRSAVVFVASVATTHCAYMSVAQDAFNRCPDALADWRFLSNAPAGFEKIVSDLRSPSTPETANRPLYFFQDASGDVALCQAAPPLSKLEKKYFSENCLSDMSVFHQTDRGWSPLPNRDQLVMCGH